MLLNKTLRSSTLKLAFFYVIGFSSAIFFVLAFVYWSTVAYVSAEADRTIASEKFNLASSTAHNMPKQISALNQRVKRGQMIFVGIDVKITDAQLVNNS